MNKSESIANLAKALSQAQNEFEGAKTDSTNPHYRSKYADIHSIINATRAPLSKYELSLVQHPEHENGVDYLMTILLHSSGEWIQSKAKMNPTKQDPQGIGAAITYFRRYCQAAMLNVAQEDDDGNSNRSDSSAPPADDSSNDSGKSKKATEKQSNFVMLELSKKGYRKAPDILKAFEAMGYSYQSRADIDFDEVNTILKKINELPEVK